MSTGENRHASGLRFFLFAVIVTVFFSGVFAQGQTNPTPPAPPPAPATMPAGWQQLDAAGFLAAAQTLYQSQPGPDAATSKAVVAQAWTAFLNNPDFIAGGDWATLRSLLGMFVPRVGELIDTSSDAARKASQATVDGYMSALRTQLQSRITSHPETLNSQSFSDFVNSVNTLMGVHFNERDRARWSAAWMNANDWKSLSMADQATLYSYLNVELLSRLRVSVRWTGQIAVPADGDYTFEQLRTFYTDGTMKLTINGQVVLNSPGVGPQEKRWCRHPKVDDPAYKSSPVTLTASQPADFRLEYVHDMTGVQLRGDFYPMGFPVAVLTWQSSIVDRQIIPSSALTPPAGFTDGSRTGLKGEYYGDASFGTLKATRLDHGLVFVWDDRPMYNAYMRERAAILAENLPKLSSATYLAALDDKDVPGFINGQVYPFVAGMSAAERIDFMHALQQQPRLLKHLDYDHLTQFMWRFYMLPGKEHLALLSAWSQTQRQPRTQAGDFSTWDWNGYTWANCYHPMMLGRLLSKPFFQDAEEIWKSNLPLPNGDCNLTLAYATCYAAKYSDRNTRVREFLDKSLQNEELTGDQRATWLFARAYAEEVSIANLARPGRGMPFLQQALAAAESNGYRFWAMQEIVTRLITVDRCHQAASLIKSMQGQFTDKAQQDLMTSWLKLCETMPAHYAQVRRDAENEATMAYIAELQNRIKQAQDSGDAAQAARYGQIVENAKATLKTK